MFLSVSAYIAFDNLQVFYLLLFINIYLPQNTECFMKILTSFSLNILPNWGQSDQYSGGMAGGRLRFLASDTKEEEVPAM